MIKIQSNYLTIHNQDYTWVKPIKTPLSFYCDNMKLNIFYDTSKFKKLKEELINENIINYDLFEVIIEEFIISN
jgi:hypothetical protein